MWTYESFGQCDDSVGKPQPVSLACTNDEGRRSGTVDARLSHGPCLHMVASLEGAITNILLYQPYHEQMITQGVLGSKQKRESEEELIAQGNWHRLIATRGDWTLILRLLAPCA